MRFVGSHWLGFKNSLDDSKATQPGEKQLNLEPRVSINSRISSENCQRNRQCDRDTREFDDFHRANNLAQSTNLV